MPQILEEFRASPQSELLPGLPEFPEFTTGSERISALGDMMLARAGWGGFLSTETLINTYGGRITELEKDQMRKLRFTGGYRFSPDVDNLFDPKLQTLQAGWATRLALEVVQARNWDTVDGLYIGSSTVTPGTIGLIASNLTEQGIHVGDVKHHSLACQSWTTGVVDALRRPELSGKNVVVVGMDTLSPMTSPDDPITYAIFGNGGGSFAFRPGTEMEYLHGVTQFEHDAQGITRCVTVCPLPPRETWLDYPDNFALIGDRTAEFLATTDYGLTMSISPSDNGKIIMNGRGTFKYFVIESHSFDLMQREVQRYEDDGSPFGPLGIPFGHQPSGEVIDGLNNFAVRQYERKHLSGSPPHFTWVMDQTPFNNISAGTGIIAMEELTNSGMLTPGSAHLMLGLGIGNSVGAHIIRFPR